MASGQAAASAHTCCAPRTHAVRLKLLPDALQVMLGVWGNSDSNNIMHWLPMVAADWPPSADLQWDEASSTCRNIAKGLQVGLSGARFKGVRHMHAMGGEPVPREAVTCLPVRNNTLHCLPCDGVVLLQVQLLTGVAYSESNLQAKLLYASACFSYSSWTFDRLNGPNLQHFGLHFHVSFVPKAGQQTAMSVKPAPPLLSAPPSRPVLPLFDERGGGA